MVSLHGVFASLITYSSRSKRFYHDSLHSRLGPSFLCTNRGEASARSTTWSTSVLRGHTDVSNDDKSRSHHRTQWLVVGDGDFSYSASVAESFSTSEINLTATVLEDEAVHNRVYQHSKKHMKEISSYPNHRVKFGIDATDLLSSFPDTRFDCVEFNFPHWRGKTNARYNRELINDFLESATTVLEPDGEIRMALCDGQGGMPVESLQEWRQSWLVAAYAADHNLLLHQLEGFEPKYSLSSHRGVDRPFFLGKHPQKYYFRFPNKERLPVKEDLQISCRHELRIVLDEDRLKQAPVSPDDIVEGDAVFRFCEPLIPEGIRFEIPAREMVDFKENATLAVFLLNYSGASMPLTRSSADNIRAEIETRIVEDWQVAIAKPDRLVSRPYPYQLLSKLLPEEEEA